LDSFAALGMRLPPQTPYITECIAVTQIPPALPWSSWTMGALALPCQPCLRILYVHKVCSEGAIRRGGGAGGSSLQNLHAMVVVGVSHDDAPVAVDGDAASREAEWSVACA